MVSARKLRTALFVALACASLPAQEHADQAAITIFNANFAVVRQSIPLDLKAGTNHVTFADATAHIEPDSVILRDPEGRRALRVLE
jgi:hypothetical protein